MAKTAESAADKLKTEKPKLTAEQAIKEIRNLRAGGLFVGNMEYVDFLLAECDKEKALRKEYQDSLAIFEPSYHAVAKQLGDLLEEKEKLNQAALGALNRLSEPSIVQEGVPS